MHKKVLNGLTILAGTMFMISCSTPSPQTQTHPPRTGNSLVASPTAIAYSPSTVTIYDETMPPTGTIEDISLIQIDVCNEYGIRRQQAQMNEILKEEASSMGGNGVVVIDNPDKKHCYAKIVQVEPSASKTHNEVLSISTSATKPILATTQ